MRTDKILILLLVAVGTAWLTTWVDNGVGIGWTFSVLRNWEQFGFFNLHGKLVHNAGGFQVNTNPEIYAGHRATSLYPAFLLYHLFGATMWGCYLYYALIAILVALSIWQLLGGTERAFWLAVIAVLTPGYVRWQTTLDPNLVAVLFGFPFSAAIIWLLSRPTLKGIHWAVLLFIILIYSSLNWTTVFVHGMLFVTLLLLGRVPARRLMGYAGLAAAMAGFVILISIASKMTPHAGTSGGLSTLLRSYGWGNEGYGIDLSTTTACLRLAAANVMGLLPALIFLGWQFWRCQGWRARGGWVFLLPALVAVVEVLGMRNYFGHHPWMSVHFILLGIILAAVVWKERALTTAAPEVDDRARIVFRLAGLAVAFTYGILVLAMGYAHTEQETNLVTLVQEHSARDTTIVVCRNRDADLAGIALRLPELFDRHLVVVTNDNDSSLAVVPTPRMILTAVQPGAGTVAGTSQASNGNPIQRALLEWYSRFIAHRRPGDKLEVGDKYFLYMPAN